MAEIQTPTNIPQPANAGQIATPNLGDAANKLIQEKLLKESQDHGLAKFIGSGLNIAQLLAASPIVFSALIGQAENISQQGKNADHSGAVGFLGMIAETLSKPFKFILEKYISKSHDENNVGANKKAFFFDDSSRRMLHPGLAKEFIGFIFTARRVLFNLLPQLSTVPTEDHDPLNPRGRNSFKATAKAFGSLSGALSPFRFITTILGGLSSIPGNLLGTVSAYNGNQKLFDLSKSFSRITDIFNPLVANLSSLFSTSKAFFDSAFKNESKEVSFGRYNIGFVHAFQGLVGSITSIPYFFGSFAKLRDLVNEKDEHDINGKRNIVKDVESFVGELAPQIKSLGFFTNQSISAIQNKVGNFVQTRLVVIENSVSKLLEALFNSNSLTKKIFSKIRPQDPGGKVVAVNRESSIDAVDAKNRYFTIAGLHFKKTQFFKEVYDFLHPIQSMLMLLPNAFVSSNDPYITDNARRPLRIFDRLLGINAMILTLPNYLIYGLSSRLPQLTLKHFESKQRKAESRGELNYSAYYDYKAFVRSIKNLPFFGSTYFGQIMSKLEVNEYTFRDESEMEKIYGKLEKQAKAQETSVKSSELIQAIRIGMRSLLTTKIGKKLFLAQRDEFGLTAEEHSRSKIYNSLGTFKEGLARIPVIGWVAGPIIETARSLYKVDTKKNRKILPGMQAAMQNLNPEVAQATPAIPQAAA